MTAKNSLASAAHAKSRSQPSNQNTSGKPHSRGGKIITRIICIDTHGSDDTSGLLESCKRGRDSSISESPRLITVLDKDRPDQAFSRIFMMPDFSGLFRFVFFAGLADTDTSIKRHKYASFFKRHARAHAHFAHESGPTNHKAQAHGSAIRAYRLVPALWCRNCISFLPFSLR